MISFDCPECNGLINLPDRAAGRTTNCPLCGKAVVAAADHSQTYPAPPQSVQVFFGGPNWWLDWGIWVTIVAAYLLLGLLALIRGWF